MCLSHRLSFDSVPHGMADMDELRKLMFPSKLGETNFKNLLEGKDRLVQHSSQKFVDLDWLANLAETCEIPMNMLDAQPPVNRNSIVSLWKTNSMETLLYWAVGICTASAAATVVAAYLVWKTENNKP